MDAADLAIDFATNEEFTSHSLYETDGVIVCKNTPDGAGDIWYSVRVNPGASVSEIQTALNCLPEYAEFDDGDVFPDGSAWLDFSR